MKRLINILKTTERIPMSYREDYTLDEIKNHLKFIDDTSITNMHVINMKSMLLTSSKDIIKIEKTTSYTADLEIDDISHSYYANGVPVHNTVNLPSDYKFSDFKNLYKEVYETGTIKGVTTYRAGTMTSVLADKNANMNRDIDLIPKTKAPKRPKELSCDIHNLMVEGKYWIVIIGLIGNDPYEVFAFPRTGVQIHNKFKHGKLIRVKSGVYNLVIGDDEIILENVTSLFGTNEQEALSRMVSTALRHGADIGFIVEQLQKSQGTIVQFSKCLARTLKTYISGDSEVNKKTLDCDECGGKQTLVMREGCFVCKNCGHSKCG